MNLYLVRRTDDVGYDEHDSFVISAKTLKIAKGLAQSHQYGQYNGRKIGRTSLKTQKAEIRIEGD